MKHRVGKEAFLAGDSPDRRYSAIFEDDRETGYFYGCELSESERQVCLLPRMG